MKLRWQRGIEIEKAWEVSETILDIVYNDSAFFSSGCAAVSRELLLVVVAF